MYSSESRKRGLPEGWVRALEKLWAVAILHAPGIDENAILTVKEGLRDPQEGGFAARWTDEGHEKGLWKIWRASRLPQELELLLPSLERLPQRKMEDVVMREATSSLQQGFNLPPRQPAAHPAVDGLEDVRGIEITSNKDNASSALPPSAVLPPDTLAAIDSYFTWTHVWFPVMEKHQVYRTFHQWSYEAAEIPSGDRACLLAILAYQKVQRSHLPAEIDVAEAGDGASPAKDLFDLVQSLIPREYHSCHLSHIQALLILSMAYLGACLWDDAWLLVGQATRLALLERTTQAQLNKNQDGTLRPDSSRLPHTLLGCFVLDTLLSTVAALPAHLRDADLSGLRQLDDDCLEEWTPLPQTHLSRAPSTGPAFTISTFNRLTEITKLLSRVSPKAWSSAASLSQLETVKAELIDWEGVQPARGRLNHIFSLDHQEAVPPNQLTVQMLRIGALILVDVRSAALQLEPNGWGNEVSRWLQQITDLLNNHVAEVDSRAIPPIWQLIFGIILNEVGRARSLLQIPVPPRFIQGLEAVGSNAKTRWPCFDTLYTRILSSRASYNPSGESPTPTRHQHEGVLPPNVQPPGTPQSLNTNEAGLFTARETGSSTDHHPFSDPSQLEADFVIDSIPTGSISNASSSIPDFVTMDALNW